MLTSGSDGGDRRVRKIFITAGNVKQDHNTLQAFMEFIYNPLEHGFNVCFLYFND